MSAWAWRVVEASAFAHAFGRGHVGATFATADTARCYYSPSCEWSMSSRLDRSGTPESARFVFVVLGSFGAAVTLAADLVAAAAVGGLLDAVGTAISCQDTQG